MTKARNKVAVGAIGLSLLAGSVQAPATANQARYTQGQIDAFAMAQLELIQPAAFQYDREYCGLIGINRAGQLVAVRPRGGKTNGCRIPRKPRGFYALASFHNHGAYTPFADTEVPSVGDLKADFRARMNGYIATPGGRVWFNNYQTRSSRMICGLGCVEADPRFRECEAMKPVSTYTVRSLKQRARDDDGACIVNNFDEGQTGD